MIASLALLRFTIHRLDALSVVLAVVVLLGAVAMLARGDRLPAVRAARRTRLGRRSPGRSCSGSRAPGSPRVAMFTNYDGFSSLWSELAEGESAEFVFEPAVLVVAILLGLACSAGSRRSPQGCCSRSGRRRRCTISA